MFDLNGKWDFSDSSEQYRLSVTFPGDAISALHGAGLIPDPYWGRNEYDLRWIAERDWRASRSFTLETVDSDLVLSGLDTIVDVCVNGETVLHSENSFRTYRIDLSQVGKVGKNEIELLFRSNVRVAAEKQGEQPYFVPYHLDNCPIPNGNMLRKMQCDFGWDWNIALAPFGVLGDMWVEPQKLARLDSLQINQIHAEDIAIVTVSAKIVGDAEGQKVVFKLNGIAKEANVLGCVACAEFTIHKPELWWPAGYGIQPLYDLEVHLGEQILKRHIGLRTIDLVVEDDDAGTGFKFRVNGKDIFAKGANWIPADALSGRINEDDVLDQLQSAVDANMNMLRIWGGGRYEPTWFYDRCDELGLMIWQDFMFACNLYPVTEEFLKEVNAEVRDNVARLNHHACIAVWCGDNELIGALNWFPESRENRDRYLVAYDRLNRTVEAALKDVCPTANWWPSSPSPGYMNFGDAWHDDSSGDMHFWSVWHENKNFDHYRDVKPRFCSEFGFQSYPSMDVIRTFASKEDMNISAPVLESHQKNKGGNERIAGTMFRYFRFPVDFENFVYLSQVQQGLAIKTAVTYWRSLKPHCMGALIWQLNDTWPVCSWSSLDYGGGWKLLHYMAKEFFRPILATIVPEDEKFTVRMINDLPDTAISEVTVFALTIEGKMRDLGVANNAIPPNAAIDVLSVDKSAIGNDELIGMCWDDGQGYMARDLFAPKPYKTYDLRPAFLEMDICDKGEHQDITVSASNLGLFVSLESDQKGQFSQNAFTVAPSYPVTLRFTPKTVGETPNFIIRDLHSATYGPAK